METKQALTTLQTMLSHFLTLQLLGFGKQQFLLPASPTKQLPTTQIQLLIDSVCCVFVLLFFLSPPAQSRGREN